MESSTRDMKASTSGTSTNFKKPFIPQKQFSTAQQKTYPLNRIGLSSATRGALRRKGQYPHQEKEPWKRRR